MNSLTPPPDDPVWAHVRLRYEQDHETVDAIANDVGLQRLGLANLAKKWGWRLRGKLKPLGKSKTKAKKANPALTTFSASKRVKDLLQQRLTELEEHIKEIGVDVTALSNERQIRSVNMLVRTLEKVIDLERKDRLRKRKEVQTHKYFDDEQRQQLADKIERLQHEWRSEKAIDGSASAGGDGAEQPVALLGQANPAASTAGP